jgi:hypothetical protein
MSHRRAHQADAQHPDANVPLIGLGVHSPVAIISETRRSGRPFGDRSQAIALGAARQNLAPRRPRPAAGSCPAQVGGPLLDCLSNLPIAAPAPLPDRPRVREAARDRDKATVNAALVLLWASQHVDNLRRLEAQLAKRANPAHPVSEDGGGLHKPRILVS